MLMTVPLARMATVLIACSLLLIGIAEARAQSVDKVVLKVGLASLKNKSAAARVDGATTLGELGQKAATAIPALINALKDSNADVRSAAADALGKIGMQTSVVLLQKR